MAVGGDLLASGTEIGGYRIDELISRGGMGLVYRCTNVALDRAYALKVLAPELARDIKFQDRFKREMRIAASLHHPNVVGIHYAGEKDGMLFFVMDFVTGTDLRQVITKTGALEPDRAVELLRQVASALDAAHASGLVHRDVKPANILISRSEGKETAYLTDFGLAKRPDTSSGLTATGLVVGTVDYMAPEQINGSRVDARTDIYALGCVFFQVLTGKVPYERDNSVATMFAHVNDPPPPLEGRIAGMYPAFARVIDNAMAKDPANRYFSAGDLARDAEAVLQGVRYSAPPTIVATGDAAVVDSEERTLAAGVVTQAASSATAGPGAPTELAGQQATAPTEAGTGPTELATDPGAAATERGAAPPTDRGTPATERRAAATERGAPPPTDRGPYTDGGAGDGGPKPPWFKTGAGAGAIGAAVLAAVVVGLFAGGVIKTGGSTTTQTSITTQTTQITSTSTTTQDSTTSTSTSSSATTVPATDPRPEGAVTAVYNYWTDIANGKYAAAYTWDGPGVAGQSQSSFVTSEQQANIQSIKFDGSLASSSGNTATVGINTLQTVDQQNGCRNWSGQYQLTYTSGTWLISSANLTPTAC